MKILSLWTMILGVALSGNLFAADWNELYRRVELLEIRNGAIEIRLVYGPRLDAPVECADTSKECTEERVFTRVYALDLTLETRTSEDGVSRIQKESRGSIYMALQFEEDRGELFDTELRKALSTLSADMFVLDYAGIKTGKAPLPGIAEHSISPSFACFRMGDWDELKKYHRKTAESRGVVSVGTSSGKITETTKPFCEQMVSSIADAFPDLIRTMPVPRSFRVQSVSYQATDTLQEQAYDVDLLQLPDEALFLRKDVEGVVSSGSTSMPGDGSFYRSTLGRDGVEWTTVTVPAALSTDSIGKNAWLSRWRLETSRHVPGPRPSERVEGELSLMLALLATKPSSEDDQDDQPIPSAEKTEPYSVRFLEDSFLDEVADRLESRSVLILAAVEAALKQEPKGLGSDGWIMVLCRSDGTASYGIMPAVAESKVLNADLFCSAIEARLK